MTKCGKRLYEKRAKLRLSQSDLAEAAEIHRSTVAHYENGTREPTLTVTRQMAKKMNISIDYLSGNDEFIQQPVRVPVYEIPAPGSGTPLLHEKNLIDYEVLNDSQNVTFCLVMNDDSMEGARIFQGDLVCVGKREQDAVTPGDILVIENREQGIWVRRISSVDEHTYTLRCEALDELNELEESNDVLSLDQVGEGKENQILGMVLYSRVRALVGYRVSPKAT